MDCHICHRWTPGKGCAHYGPTKLKTLADKIVAFAHGGNTAIVETDDFLMGVKYTLEYLKAKRVKLPKGAKLKYKNGGLTPYAFDCGYIQFASIDGTENEKLNNGKELYMDGSFHVKQYKNGERIRWESYDTLSEAKKQYNKIKIN